MRGLEFGGEMDRAAIVEVGCVGSAGAGENTGWWVGADEGLGEGVETDLSFSEHAMMTRGIYLRSLPKY